jgi:predicted nucleotidyltransferase
MNRKSLRRGSGEGIWRRALDDFACRVRKVFAERAVDVILYGSYARGDESAGSDMDVLVVLRDPVVYEEEIRRLASLAFDINLEYGVFLVAMPESELAWRQAPDRPGFLRSVHAEAIAL